MRAGAEEIIGRVALLDNATGIHDGDAAAGVGNDAKIVRDEQMAMPLGPRLRHQLEDLRLHRHVERGRRLIGDQRSGPHASAMAIITRWRMPPESWCG